MPLQITINGEPDVISVKRGNGQPNAQPAGDDEDDNLPESEPRCQSDPRKRDHFSLSIPSHWRVGGWNQYFKTIEGAR